MKKYLIFLFIIMFIFVGCTKKEDKIDEFQKSINNFSFKNYTLLEYTKTQEYSDKGIEQLVYSKTLTLKIASLNPLLAMKTEEEKEMNTFPSEEQFTVTKRTTYFDGDLVYNENKENIEEQLSFFEIKESLAKLINKDNFVEYSEDCISNNTLTVKIDKKIFSTLFDATGVDDVKIILKIDDDNLKSLTLSYILGQSIFQFNYEFSKTKQIIELP